MRRKYYKTLAALVLLGAVGGGIAYYEKRAGRDTGKSESPPSEKLLALETKHIQALAFKPRDGEAFVCRREGENWVIAGPRKLPADAMNVSGVLNSLTGATVDQVIEAKPSNLKDYGLDPPAFTLEVSASAKPEKSTLRLGDETPTGGGVYALVEGNPRVVSLASYMKSSLEKTRFELRDKRAVTLEAAQFQRVEVESKNKKFTLVKNPQGVWNLELPPAVRADRFTAEGVVSRLSGLAMQAILGEDKKKSGQYGFASPALRVTVISPAGRQALRLGKKQGEQYVAMNSALEPIFTLREDFLTQTEKDADDLRDKDLFTFSAFEAKRLEVDAPGGRRVLEKGKDKWKQSGKDLPAAKVEALLNRLRDLRAESFPTETNLATLGLAKPAYRFQVRFGDKKQSETVEASRVGERVYARRSADALASEVSKSTLDDIEKALKEMP